MIEIGSGHSTRFARWAIDDASASTAIVSIDPQPRAEVDALCDTVVRSGLEHADLSLFGGLAPGDIIFFDGSHRCFTNSDVAAFFLDVLPRLPSGVLVQIHDVYLPFGYPPELSRRYYSEHYLLAVHLLASGSTRVVLPNAWLCHDTEFAAQLAELWSGPGLRELERWGGSFWFETGA